MHVPADTQYLDGVCARKLASSCAHLCRLEFDRHVIISGVREVLELQSLTSICTRSLEPHSEDNTPQQHQVKGDTHTHTHTSATGLQSHTALQATRLGKILLHADGSFVTCRSITCDLSSHAHAHTHTHTRTHARCAATASSRWGTTRCPVCMPLSHTDILAHLGHALLYTRDSFVTCCVPCRLSTHSWVLLQAGSVRVLWGYRVAGST